MQNNYTNDDNTFTSGYHYVDNPSDNFTPEAPNTIPDTMPAIVPSENTDENSSSMNINNTNTYNTDYNNTNETNESNPDSTDNVYNNSSCTNSSYDTAMPSTEQYAGFGVRMFAYIIDNLILFVGLLIIRIILFIAVHIVGLDFLSNEILFQYSLSDIFLYIIRVAYFVLMTYFTGATLGKHLLKIHVVSADSSEKYSFFDILYRETVGRFLSKIILYIGYFFAIANQDKAALHDMLSLSLIHI